MPTDGQRAVLDQARGQVPAAWEDATELGTFTRRRIERIIGIAAGIGSIFLGVQAVVAAIGPNVDERPEWHVPLMLAAFVPLSAMIVAALVGRAVRATAAAFAIIYVVILVIWPLATTGSDPDPTGEPWIFLLTNIATLAAVLAFSVPLQLAWTAGAPLLFGIVRLVQVGFDPRFFWPLGLDVSFALLLGSVLLALGWLFRSMATGVDQSRARAVASYAAAASSDAAEQERVAVAALMHDSVLAALIAAERADTARERTLAVAMAREALTRLANAEQDAGEGSDEPRSGCDIARAIEHAALELGARMTATTTLTDDAAPVPGRVARALVLAATQAIANALEHAGGRGLAVDLAATPEHLLIRVHDAGGGFDLDRVPEDRLGIRGSILARVAAVRGIAQVESGSAGTTVTLEWRQP